MNPALHPVDLAVIAVYFVALLALGFRGSKWRDQRRTDYLLAGRKLTLIPFTASFVATWYGGILGVGEFTYRYGISNWIVFGLPYYLFALIFALFLAERIRSSKLTTIPDRFYSQYGSGAGLISAILVMVLSSPAPYILSAGIILKIAFGFSAFNALLVAALVSLIYIYYGGFRSVIRTDILQFILMFAGFGCIVLLATFKYGGFSALQSGLPDLHLTWKGGNTTQYILVWFFIALWTFVDPGFYQRCAAADNPVTAKKGILVSIGFWAIFDFLTLSTGLYARMILPGLDDPMMAIPSLGLEILPPVLLGLFLVGVLSTIMSTVDSLGFISAITFGRDIVWRWRRGTGDPIRWTQIGLIVTAAVSLLLAWLLPSVVTLWYAIGSVVVPGLLIPLLVTFWGSKKIPGVAWMMALSAGTGLGWFLVGVTIGGETPHYPFGIEPFYPGMVVSIGWYAVTVLMRYK